MLPPKPGGAVQLQFGPQPLEMETTLKNQGFSQETNLSYVYVPVSMLDAWRFFRCDIDEEEDATPEVASEGAQRVVSSGLGCRRKQLPANVRQLVLGNEVTKELEESWTLPNNLEALKMGIAFGGGLPQNFQWPPRLLHLTLGMGHFDLHRAPLPETLQTLTLGARFDAPLRPNALPGSLKSITFGADFDQPLDGVILPSGLETLTFGVSFNQSLVQVKLPIALRVLHFGDEYNQRLDDVMWPPCMEALSLGARFYWDLDGVLPPSLRRLVVNEHYNEAVALKSISGLSLESLTFMRSSQVLGAVPTANLLGIILGHMWPKNLKSLTFGPEISRDLQDTQLPETLEHLTLGQSFDESLEGVDWPKKLKSLRFGHKFNQSLLETTLPEELQELSFGHCFNQSLEGVTLPETLLRLSFGYNFNQPLEEVNFPKELQHLSFGHEFNQTLQGVRLPDGLLSLTLGYKFNLPFRGVKMPENLQSLTFSYDFDQELTGDNTLPESLRSLVFGYSFNRRLEFVTFPPRLEVLSFGSSFDRSLDKVQLPGELKMLVLGCGFHQSLKEVSFPPRLETLICENPEVLRDACLSEHLQHLSSGGLVVQGVLS
ncbi:unnamed protein product [Durusdinium trenchii]|uniref:Uncharacterized protein n=2 Tax=Durusdinium trenchii TaxID=1381693 RepID=A0ABP0S1I7_9DINO